MEIIKNLITRFRRMGVLFLFVLILISYIAFGFVYFQHGGQQRKYEEQIAKLDAILAKPLPSSENLQTEYEEVNRRLTEPLVPITNPDAIARLVGIAEKSGINVDTGAGKLHVSPASFSSVTMGSGTYRLLSFSNVYVQGDHDNVTAFLTDLESGKTLETMVLKRVVTNEVIITFAGEEAARRAEFRKVAAAVLKMMDDIGLTRIPYPINLAGGVATNIMGDDPVTVGTVEGFPDITTTATERGYSGNVTPRDGLVLYKHDKISTDNTTQFEPVSYIDTLTTKYYYTCDSDGTVRQFGEANIATAKEYLESAASKTETVATVDVNIYTKP
ncbi:hypothetical protein ACFLTR_02050 [Chloroflexota bacterium]